MWGFGASEVNNPRFWFVGIWWNDTRLWVGSLHLCMLSLHYCSWASQLCCHLQTLRCYRFDVLQCSREWAGCKILDSVHSPVVHRCCDGFRDSENLRPVAEEVKYPVAHWGVCSKCWQFVRWLCWMLSWSQWIACWVKSLCFSGVRDPGELPITRRHRHLFSWLFSILSLHSSITQSLYQLVLLLENYSCPNIVVQIV